MPTTPARIPSRFSLLVALLLLATIPAFAADPVPPVPGWRTYSYIGPAEKPQPYGVYIPPCYDPAHPIPLLVSINKRGSPATTEYMPYADIMGFAIIGFPLMGMDDAPDRDGTLMDSLDRLIAGGGFHGQVNIDRAAVVAVGQSGGVPFGVWAPAGQHPEVFTALVSQCGNFFGDGPVAAFATRPILILWAEDDRATILKQTPEALAYFKGTLGCTKLTTELVPAGQGGHTCYPDRVIAWWTRTLTPRAPTIRVQPRDQVVGEGQHALFTVQANGIPAPTYAWQWSADGSTWQAVPAGSGGTSASCTASGAPGARFRCVVANASGSVTTAVAAETVSGGAVPAPTITGDTGNQIVEPGRPATFGVTANGGPHLAYQWQASFDRKVWIAICTGTGYDAATYTTLPATPGDQGMVLRCVVTSPGGAAISGPMTLQMTPGNAGTAPYQPSQPRKTP